MAAHQKPISILKAMEKRKRKKPWTAQEEELLVEIWGERINQLRGARKNSHVYEEIKNDLQTHGCEVSAMEVKSKIHNLTTRYRKEKDLIGPSGGSPSSWSLYYSIHGILGSHKMNNVSDLIEESINESIFSNVEALDEYSQNISFDIEFGQTPYSEEGPSCSSSSTSIQTPLPSPCEPEKKRKRIDYQQEILSRIDKIGEEISMQHEEMKRMDERMYELEVKKTKLMEKFVSSAEEYKNAFLNFLNK